MSNQLALCVICVITLTLSGVPPSTATSFCNMIGYHLFYVISVAQSHKRNEASFVFGLIVGHRSNATRGLFIIKYFHRSGNFIFTSIYSFSAKAYLNVPLCRVCSASVFYVMLSRTASYISLAPELCYFTRLHLLSYKK